MKSMIEYMATVFIMMLLSFFFVSFIAIEIQITYARNYHTRVIETIQYEGDYENIDLSNYSDNLTFIKNDDNTIEVIYDYDINTPFFKTLKAKSLIGYAR